MLSPVAARVSSSRSVGRGCLSKLHRDREQLQEYGMGVSGIRFLDFAGVQASAESGTVREPARADRGQTSCVTL